MVKNYKKYLESSRLASNRVKAYTKAIELFYSHYSELSNTNLEEHRKFLIKNYKPQSVNLNIIGINRYLSYLGKKELSLHVLKRQQKILLEKIIDNKQYNTMKQFWILLINNKRMSFCSSSYLLYRSLSLSRYCVEDATTQDSNIWYQVLITWSAALPSRGW